MVQWVCSKWNLLPKELSLWRKQLLNLKPIALWAVVTRCQHCSNPDWLTRSSTFPRVAAHPWKCSRASYCLAWLHCRTSNHDGTYSARCRQLEDEQDRG